MHRRFIISAILLILSVVIDQATKQWGRSLPSLHYNQGLIMGLYAGLPESIRIVALGCFAGIVFFLYIFLLYILPARAWALNYGLSLLVGGMFGNVIDKIIFGKTVDFIPLSLGGIQVVLNIADVILWLGAGLVAYVILGRDKLVWHPDSVRGNFLVWPREQYKVGMNFSLVVFSCALVLGIFSFTFFNTTVAPALVQKERLMLTFALTYGLITLLFCLLAFLAGVVIGHRSAGPLYAFENYVDDLISGKDRKLSFREGDNYKDLVAVADRLREFVNNRRS